MISFDGLVLGTELPIYQQIVLYIKRGIAAGTILTGDELPSRRMLSALLGVNPNTIQKAYRLLEEEGLISSHAGAKSLVSADAGTTARLKRELLRDDVQSLIRVIKQAGVSWEDAADMIKSLWEETK